MPELFITISEELEARLRRLNRKKGDLSRIISEALNEYLPKLEKRQR